jgi:hypothetical protein
MKKAMQSNLLHRTSLVFFLFLLRGIIFLYLIFMLSFLIKIPLIWNIGLYLFILNGILSFRLFSFYEDKVVVRSLFWRYKFNYEDITKIRFVKTIRGRPLIVFFSKHEQLVHKYFLKYWLNRFDLLGVNDAIFVLKIFKNKGIEIEIKSVDYVEEDILKALDEA